MKIRKKQKKEEKISYNEKLLEDYKERLLRQQAEFENYKKQLDREKDAFRKLANEALIKDLLTTADDLERAYKQLEKKDKGIAQGIKMIYEQFMKTLESHGLKRIEPIGKKFDPYYHEALLQEESDKPEGTILEELKKGYMLNLNVIRHSQVKISKSKD